VESRRRRWSSNEAELSGPFAASREADAGRESRCKPWTRVIDADVGREERLRDESLPNQDGVLFGLVAIARESSTLETRSPGSPTGGMRRSCSEARPRSDFDSSASRHRSRRPSRRATARRITAQSRWRALRSSRLEFGCTRTFSNASELSSTFFATRADNASHGSENESHSCVAEEIECARTSSRSVLGEVVAAVPGESALHRDLACRIGRARRSRLATPSTSP
jgi:hypothetical protein